MKIGNADASKNNKNKNKFVQLNAPIKQISKRINSTQNNSIFTPEYQAVNKEISSTNVLKIINGRLKLLFNSNR